MAPSQWLVLRHRRFLFILMVYIATVSISIMNNSKLSGTSAILSVQEEAKLSEIYRGKRISVSFHKLDGSAYYTRFSHISMYLCGDEQGNHPIPSTIQKYFNFSASIRTDLKILFMGDSITGQFAEAFDSAALDVGEEGSVRATTSFLAGNPAHNLVHLCMSISSPIRGGGVSAFWRVTTLLSKETNLWPAKCTGDWRYWNEGQALTFLNHEYNSTLVHSHNSQKDYLQEILDRSNRINEFDAVILRAPHGWLSLDRINATRIIEAIETTSRILGATTIIITTLPMSNNVQNADDWKIIAEINHMIREVARNFTESHDDSKYVLVQEFGNLTNQVLVENAKNLGLMSSTNNGTQHRYSKEGWEVDMADIFLQRPTKQKWPSSHVQVCSSLASEENCPRVKISPDGMHWCVETFGARYVSSIACLLGCVYNVDEPPTSESVRDCEQICNDQFMSLSFSSTEWPQQ